MKKILTGIGGIVVFVSIFALLAKSDSRKLIQNKNSETIQELDPYNGMKVVKKFSNGLRLYRVRSYSRYPYVLEGNPNHFYSSNIEFVDKDEDLETAMVLWDLYGKPFVDVRRVNEKQSATLETMWILYGKPDIDIEKASGGDVAVEKALRYLYGKSDEE